MPETAKGSVLTEYFINELFAPVASVLPHGLEAVYYGDQEYIPKVPALCIEPAVVTRELIGTAMRTDNILRVSMLLYFADVQGVEDAQRGADTFAEAVIDAVNADGAATGAATPQGTRFGGNVIIGFVESSEYGYIVKANKLMRANRMMVWARSRTNLLEA